MSFDPNALDLPTLIKREAEDAKMNGAAAEEARQRAKELGHPATQQEVEDSGRLDAMLNGPQEQQVPPEPPAEQQDYSGISSLLDG